MGLGLWFVVLVLGPLSAGVSGFRVLIPSSGFVPS